MAPMNWTLLFLIFVSLYLIAMILIYFLWSSPELKPSTSQDNKTQTEALSWKW